MILDGDCSISLSRGALREGFAAIEAFGDLLGSRRVGPRALERAKSDTFEACEALISRFAPFKAKLAAALGNDDDAVVALDKLCERVTFHVFAMTNALADAKPLSARRRLELEAVFRKHRTGLKDCVVLCDMAVAVAEPTAVDLDVVDLLEQRHGDRAIDGPVVRLGIDSARPMSIHADRHVLAGLVEAAVSFVCRAGATEARLVAGINSDGAFVIRVGPAPRAWSSPKRTVTLPLRSEVDVSVQVARMLGPRAGLGISFDATTNTVTIVPKSRASTC